MYEYHFLIPPSVCLGCFCTSSAVTYAAVDMKTLFLGSKVPLILTDLIN